MHSHNFPGYHCNNTNQKGSLCMHEGHNKMLTRSPMRKLSFWRGKEKKRRKNKSVFADASTDASTASSSPRPADDGSFPRPHPPLSAKSSFDPSIKLSPRSSRSIAARPPDVKSLTGEKNTDDEEQKDSNSYCSTPPRLESNDKNTIAQAAALDTIGNTLLEKGDYPRAIQTYERALALKRISLKCGGGTLPNQDLLASVATSINNISYLRQRSGNGSPQECLNAYQDSLLIKREILGEDSLAVGKTLNNIGSVHYSSRHYEQALDSYLQAKRIMQHNLGLHHLDVATVFSNIGDVYMATCQREQAHSQYKSALEIRWMHLEEHSPKIRRLLEKIAIIEMNQEFLLDENDESDEEDRMLEEEIDLPVYRELHNLHSEVEADIRDVSMLRRKMALDMVKDKLRILKELKNMSGNHDDSDDDSRHGEPKTPPPSLSPMERTEALSSVKSRLAKLREQRALMGESCSSLFSTNTEQDEEDARIEKELGLEHLQMPQLNLDSVLGS